MIAAPRSSRCARVAAHDVVEIGEAAVPRAAAGQVVVTIRFCGICGSDVHALEDPGLFHPSVFGHEWTGTVLETGTGVTGAAVGDRVAVAVGPPCLECATCRAGHPDLCETVAAERGGRTPGSPAHGGFATHLAVPARRVLRVDDRLTDLQAALVEPTAVAARAVRLAGVGPRDVVLVQGAGPIGLLVAQLARRAGAVRVLVVEPGAARREIARQLGLGDVHEPGPAARRALAGASDGRGADVVLECSGLARLVQPAAEQVRRGGTLALVGYTKEPTTVSYADWVSRELRVVGSLACARQDLVAAMAAIADGSVITGPLVGGTVGLAGLAGALRDLGSGRSAFAKVLVDPAQVGATVHRLD